jgi:AcrR family transcriptional regulator
MRRVRRPRRGEYHHGDLRRALVDASLEILAEQGHPELGLREVARRAGVSHAAPYHHFRSKEDLEAAVAEQSFQDLRRRLLDHGAHGGPAPFERLAGLGVAYVLFAVEHPARFALMFRAARDVSRHPTLATAARQALEVLIEALSECLGTAAPMDVTIVAWSLVHGLAVLWIDGPLRSLDRRGIESLSSIVASTLSDLLHARTRR